MRGKKHKGKKTKKKKAIIELNIISSLELKKYLKSFLFIWLFFYFHKYCSTLTTISDKITVEL